MIIMDPIRRLIQSILTRPRDYLNQEDTNIIGLENILTQIFQIIGIYIFRNNHK
jgi:hypothetical protein